MIRSSCTFMYCLMLTLALGCEVNRATPSIKPTANDGVTIDTVQITGPYSIGADGAVSWAAVTRPDGDLIGTRVGRELSMDTVDAWIRSTTIATGGSIGRVRAISGPYRLEPDDPDETPLYDVTLEIWSHRTSP